MNFFILPNFDKKDKTNILAKLKNLYVGFRARLKFPKRHNIFLKECRFFVPVSHFIAPLPLTWKACVTVSREYSFSY